MDFNNFFTKETTISGGLFIILQESVSFEIEAHWAMVRSLIKEKGELEWKRK